jgi:hypothetical protein
MTVVMNAESAALVDMRFIRSRRLNTAAGEEAHCLFRWAGGIASKRLMPSA